MTTQRFCLRWNNHQSNMLSVFDQLLHAETFTDVTLAVEGHLLKAHKMVLSACSPYFQALFVSHQEKDPIVILKDVPYSDMKSLLDFMYRGEVSVDQERLTAFLRVAESLRIKGLTEVNEEKGESQQQQQQQQQSPNLAAPPLPPPPPPPQLHRLHRGGNNSGVPMQAGSPQGAPQGGQPKRKRGRPRKLSGGEEIEALAAKTAAANAAAASLVKSEPEKLEVALGTEGFAPDEDQLSGDEDSSLHIDEGDEPMHPASPPNHSDSAAASVRRLLRNAASASFRDDDHPNATPVITLELVPKPPRRSQSPKDSASASSESGDPARDAKDPSSSDYERLASSALFLAEIMDADAADIVGEEATDDMLVMRRSSPARTKNELLEYLTRSDGSVVCKICGEILQSRTHWYRHKYKFHVQPLQQGNVQSGGGGPAPIFKCEHCNVFFKSRKGYIGHMGTRHPDTDSNSEHPPSMEPSVIIKQEPLDAELSIPSCELPNANYTGAIAYSSSATSNNAAFKVEAKRSLKFSNKASHEMTGAEWEQQRLREERLVADIIARVRRECEASGGTSGGGRRGYSRRSALTNG